MPPIGVLIASRDRAGRAACREALARAPGIRVVGEARSGIQTLAMVGMLKPRILLLDLTLSWVEGRSLLPAVRQRHAPTRVMLLCRSSADASTLETVALGARGCLAWDGVPASLAAAVKAVDAGEAWLPRRMVAELMDRLAALTAMPGPRAAAGAGA